MEYITKYIAIVSMATTTHVSQDIPIPYVTSSFDGHNITKPHITHKFNL